jgi:hypothetical protein
LEESNLGQDAAVVEHEPASFQGTGSFYDESDPCEEAAVPCDEPEETVTACDEPAYWELPTALDDEPAPCEEAAVPCNEPASWEEAVVSCEAANTCCTRYSSWEGTISDDEPIMIENPSESTNVKNGEEGEKRTMWDEDVGSCERPENFW